MKGLVRYFSKLYLCYMTTHHVVILKWMRQPAKEIPLIDLPMFLKGHFSEADTLIEDEMYSFFYVCVP
jgi:hypothetical protein